MPTVAPSVQVRNFPDSYFSKGPHSCPHSPLQSCPRCFRDTTWTSLHINGEFQKERKKARKKESREGREKKKKRQKEKERQEEKDDPEESSL